MVPVDDASKARALCFLVPALVMLIVTWCRLQRLTAAGRWTTRAAAAVTTCWALPFAAGPIIASRDAYAYVAQGELARRGLDPAQTVVSRLGPGPLLDAVDPRWRDTKPPYGGIAVAIQRLAATGDRHPAVSLLILRLVALASVVVIVVLTARLVDPARRPFVIVLLGANPLVLIHLVAAAHLDAVATALLVAALALTWGTAVRRDRVRRVAIVLCTLGALVKLPVGLGVAYLVVCALVLAPPGRRLLLLAGDALAAVVAVGLSVVVSGHGLGWLHNFGTPGLVRTGIAPADLLAKLMQGAAAVVGVSADDADLLNAARLVALVVGAALAVRLLAPSRASGGWTPPTPERLGLALLALGLLGPVLYAWYLAPALPLLAVAAARQTGTALSRQAQGITVGLSVLLTATSIPSLAPVWRLFGG